MRTHYDTVGHLIDGQIVADESRTQPIFNPSTGESTRQVSLASKATVEQAIAATEAAYPAWRNTPPIKRARVMFRFKELLEQNADHIAQLIGEEHGKIQHDALGELQRGIENVEYACPVVVKCFWPRPFEHSSMFFLPHSAAAHHYVCAA